MILGLLVFGLVGAALLIALVRGYT